MKKIRGLVVGAVIAAATLAATPVSPAYANGTTGSSCPYGRACAWDASTSTYWYALSCGFHNMGDQGWNDKADAYKTHGNAVMFGNYTGVGDPYNFDNYTNYEYHAAWSDGTLTYRNVHDAMFVYC